MTLSPMNEPVAVAPRSVMDVVLFKYQALGNSYLILDPKRNPGWPRPIQPEPGWINAVCDADYGIGSNGLLIGPDRINGTEFEFRIINSDGSQA
jgi:diaminopimelate epimerase